MIWTKGDPLVLLPVSRTKEGLRVGREKAATVGEVEAEVKADRGAVGEVVGEKIKREEAGEAVEEVVEGEMREVGLEVEVEVDQEMIEAGEDLVLEMPAEVFLFKEVDQPSIYPQNPISIPSLPALSLHFPTSPHPRLQPILLETLRQGTIHRSLPCPPHLVDSNYSLNRITHRPHLIIIINNKRLSIIITRLNNNSNCNITANSLSHLNRHSKITPNRLHSHLNIHTLPSNISIILQHHPWRMMDWPSTPGLRRSISRCR